MILNDKTINDIKNESGLLFDKAIDFTLLCNLIKQKTKRQIGETTLKRLFCYINDDRNTSEYTLNTIAIYLGYSSWNEYSTQQKTESEWGFNDDSLYVQALDPGTQIGIQYLNRKVIFVVKKVENNNVLEVISVENGSLQIGDVLKVHKIKKGAILEAESVERNSNIGNYKTNGEIRVIEIKQL